MKFSSRRLLLTRDNQLTFFLYGVHINEIISNLGGGIAGKKNERNVIL